MSSINKSTVYCSHSAWELKRRLVRQNGYETYMVWGWCCGNPHGHMSGIYSFHPYMIAICTGLSEAEITNCLHVLAAENLIAWDLERNLLYIPSVVEQGATSLKKSRDGAKRQNTQRLATQNHIDGLPMCDLVAGFAARHDLLPPQQIGKGTGRGLGIGSHDLRGSLGGSDGGSDGGYEEPSSPFLEVGS
jgi:hypothetical protein